MKLHIDIETYSSVDLKKSGVYKYAESIDFEILLLAYAFSGEEVRVVDLAAGERIPPILLGALKDPAVTKCAHNAAFERICLRAYGIDTRIEEWFCTSVKASYCGLPASLGELSKVLQLGEAAKMDEGKTLIRYFTQPCKPSKVNGQRKRNQYSDDPERWEAFKKYCIRDVVAEKAVDKKLNFIDFPAIERRNYIVDQYINDRGVKIDLTFAKRAEAMDDGIKERAVHRLTQLSGIENPKSPTQLSAWVEEQIGESVDSVDKESLKEIRAANEDNLLLNEVLSLKELISKTSTKKYSAMIECACESSRAYGLFQFYGANRTGRWAGRLIQLQNLPRNYMSDLDLARRVVREGDEELALMLFKNVPNVLSELIRTAFIPEEGKAFVVCDFSAIEARVLAWLAGEQWRLDVFNTHGKIYEASASKIFGVPLEQITKGSEYRQRGKVAELALGYQGGVGAMRQMDSDGKLNDLSDEAVKHMVTKWRRANPSIEKLWQGFEDAAKGAIRSRRDHSVRGITFSMKGSTMLIQLPAGRSLCFHQAQLRPDKYGREKIVYKGMDQVRKMWSTLDSYGGKLVENVVQAIARDILTESLYRLHRAGYETVIHVHDEVVCETPVECAKDDLKKISDLMVKPLTWAPGLPLGAEGFTTLYYKKD